MEKEIVVKYEAEETMVAVMEDQQLAEIYFEREEKHRFMGNIYWGIVETVLPGMQAAFINMGEEKNGFLYINDAVPKLLDDDGNVKEPTQRIDQVLKQGQRILVQIMKEPVGTKGARVTTHPTLPGRYLVLMPTVSYVSISRRIEDETERERLKTITQGLLPKQMGAIIRTVAAGVSQEEIQKDLEELVRRWQQIQQRANQAKAPSLIYQDSDLLERMVRDLFVGEIAKIHVNSEICKAKIQDILERVLPQIKERVVIARRDIMDVYDLSYQLNKALQPKVWLKCGGYLIVEHTEALTAIDVNTGKFVGERNLDATVLQTNLEAAVELARQIRLRNLGGIIIVDFIDMKSEADKQQVLACLEAELKKDRVKTNLFPFTQLGLLEMTRKKNGPQLADILQKKCPFCNGSGLILAAETAYLQIKKEIFQVAANTNGGIYVEADPVLASYLIGSGGGALAKLEQQVGKPILVKGKEDRKANDFLVRPAAAETIHSQAVSPVKLGEVLEVTIAAVKDEQRKDGIAKVDGFVIIVEDGAAYLGQRRKVKIDDIYATYAKAILLSMV